MESVTDMVADASVAQLLAEQAAREPDKLGSLGTPIRFHSVTYEVNHRLATPADELHIITAFSRMLQELEPLGHDVLPTDSNLDFFWANIFLPALDKGRHGVVLAFAEGECIGATFFTPEATPLDTPPGRAVAHGAWVVPRWRSQGVALQMQQLAHSHLRQLGFTHLISNVVAANRAGLASCKAAGATVAGYMTSVALAAEGVS